MLNKHTKWFHSSRVKFPLVRMSAGWFLVSMYLIWILESRLIQSNYQSSATLQVLETCLIVGLHPLMIILITASLSSNTYNKASWREDCTFEGTESMSSITLIFFWDLWRLWKSLSGCPDRSETWETFPKTKTIRSHNSRAGKRSNLSPVSKEIISDSVNCEKQKFVFCTSNLLERMCDFRKCIMFLQKWISNLQDLPRSQSLEQSQSALFGSISHITI